MIDDVFRRLSWSITSVFVGVVTLAAPSDSVVADEGTAQVHELRQFITTYCVECHSTDDPSGERDFESFDLESVNDDALILTQELIDQLNLGAMPPDDAAQPTLAERGAFVDAVTEQLAQRQRSARSTGGQTVLRRLSRREYLATIGDLFAMDMSMFDPTTRFPSDNTVEHLDNIGDTLVMSGYLLEQYLDAADVIVEKALFDLDKPAERKWNFKGRFPTQPELSIAHRRAFDYRYLCLYDCPLADKPEGAYGSIKEFEDGVPHDGEYEIKVLAQALHRDSPYDVSQLKIDLEEPFRLGIRPGKLAAGELHVMQPIQPLLAEADVADNQLRWYTFRVHLDRGMTPRFTFENGMNGMRSLHTRFHRQYNAMLPPEARGGAGIVAGRNAMLKHGQMPQIRIHEVSIRGPITDRWPSPAVASILPDGVFDGRQAEQVIANFADKAFRRPLREDELERLMAIYRMRIDSGRTSIGAMKDSLKAILCSPAFLYFESRGDSGQLSQHALAERLSYFLTGSMPDSRLRHLADQGKLHHEQLVNETRRLMDSERVAGMVNGFTDAWLGLRALGEMPPDRNAFWQYYAKGLEAEMKSESRLFLHAMINENLPLTEWLQANYSYLNRDLARHYGIIEKVDPQKGEVFRRVVFDDPRRGGLLGQASVLTVSANGIETSPVVRGVWMLETVLGTPPPPPPDDVPPIDPDVRGAKGIRELLDKHRTLEACNQCHRKIDPMGFALECFDPVGSIRSRYPNRSAIDTSGKLPGGQTFSGPAELRQILVEQKAFFARAFTTKLLAYATGRRTEAADRAAINQILAELDADDYPTRTLIERLVLSEPFLTR
ncbi:DUF1592 domain-containing protein [Rhodopirellula sp. MGV]|uniref:DUF1592 domain-containing protein n=1 Tax=Rhodopirellula sp. MGV TaxID=2023130 RepID=UPI000B9651D0|nr:DUF1592 domain-containing protein [Rhodopirellula sp. MGV]OYP32276.1 hypothetical protein CGZ80_19610 [Rhodopirellula sp. MGV]PNY35940.1 DUF1592 domain-containing protein [Rhodopirellula baltica]